ncbi:MAG: hypothetical protein RR235_04385 [Oscillospiraceae bacterium]
MKRLIKKLCIFSIPFAVAVIMFFIFEPYDYFGLKDNATYISKPLSSMRELMQVEPENIILGDSRMANLNTEYINGLTGEKYTMMGFGGAQLGESMELFWYSTTHTKLKKVYFGVSFYTSSGDQPAGRIPFVEENANSILSFMKNFNHWLEALDTLKYKTQNKLAFLLGNHSWLWYPEDPTTFDVVPLDETRGVKYRKNIEDYCEVLKKNMNGFVLEDSVLLRLEEIIDYCDKEGIELIFVFPPMQRAVFELVTEPLCIDDDIKKMKDFLIERATVYDLEFKNAFTDDEDNFYDGFHLASDKKHYLAELLFTDIDSEAIVRHVKKGA